MAKMYYEQDCDLQVLNGKKIAIIGYGSQGHAHAQNLRDSGCDVIIGLRKGKSWEKAEKDGFTVMTVPEAVKAADIIVMLVNDERAADIYRESVGPYLTAGKAIATSRSCLLPMSMCLWQHQRGPAILCVHSTLQEKVFPAS